MMTLSFFNYLKYLLAEFTEQLLYTEIPLRYTVIKILAI